MTKPPPQSTYSRCDCGFYTIAEDSHCPNCGSDHRKLAIVKDNIGGLCLFLSTPVLLFCLIAILGGKDDTGSSLAIQMHLPLAAVYLTLFSALCVMITGGYLTRKRTHPVNLRKREALLESRLERLTFKQKELSVTLSQLTQNTKSNTDDKKAIGSLNLAAEAIEKQSARYRNQLHEIGFTRWINYLEPLVTDWGYLTEADCDSRIWRVSNSMEKGQQMLKEWERDVALSGEGGKNVERLQKALETCSLLRSELVAKKAGFIIQDVAPLMEPSNTSITNPAHDYKSTLFEARVEAIQEIWSSYESLNEDIQTLQSR